MKPVAFVIPWFGKELLGGAEQLTWQVTTRLAARGHRVEVLTTCCRAFHDDWATNHLPAGTNEAEGVTIRRFAVSPRNRTRFDEVNGKLLALPHSALNPSVDPLSAADETTFVQHNINSNDLAKHLHDRRDDYTCFVFIPYLYGSTLTGLSAVADHAFLHPCLHDEAYAYLRVVADLFRLARGILFITEGEAQLAYRLYGPGIFSQSVIVGGGVEVSIGDSVGERTDRATVPAERFVLCLGRRDSTKNTDLIVKAYERFRAAHPASTLQLVLAGPGQVPWGAGIHGVHDLGVVEETHKASLLAHCTALVQPSRNESYSRVIMEAWLHGRPVAAHRDCLATARSVAQAEGGWIASSEEEWADLFHHLDEMAVDELDTYGAKGRRYARENASWPAVIERYERALGLSKPAGHLTTMRAQRLRAIHQLLPAASYGDAVSNHAFAMRAQLRSRGYTSEIFVAHTDPSTAHEVNLVTPQSIPPTAGLFYHHCTGSDLARYAVDHSGPKCLVYHTITPAAFYQPHRPDMNEMLRHDRSELYELAQHFRLSLGVSGFNVAALRAHGFVNPGLLPIAVDPTRWNLAPDPLLMRELQDGKDNIIVVGRLAPHKYQDQLIEAFAHYMTMTPAARLIIIGKDSADGYASRLQMTVRLFRLGEHVLIPGHVHDSQLVAYYRTAHLFWSMSEHEGFFVPAVEAMWFDVPVLAYKSTAVKDTLGEAAVMFTSKTDLARIAALAKMMVHDSRLRGRILAAQARRRLDFAPEAVWRQLDIVLQQFEAR